MASALNVLSDPVRRRIVEIVAVSEKQAGSIVNIIGTEFDISQPAVSQHLKVLKEHNITRVRKDASRRLYSINPNPFKEIDIWLTQFRKFWEKKLDDLEQEIEKGKSNRVK